MNAGLKIAIGAGILYALYRWQRLEKEKVAAAAVKSPNQPLLLPAPDITPTTPKLSQDPTKQPTPVARPAASPVTSRKTVPARKVVRSGADATEVGKSITATETFPEDQAKADAQAGAQAGAQAPQVQGEAPEGTAAEQSAAKGRSGGKAGLRLVGGGDGLDATRMLVGVPQEERNPLANGAELSAKIRRAAALSAVRKPLPDDADSEVVVDDVRDNLDEQVIRSIVSPALAQTLNRVQPRDIPFDHLPEDAKTLLLRGYAADYVTQKAIDEPGYSAAVDASTKTGLPIGWTQMIIARGVKPENVYSVSVEVVKVFADEARAEAAQTVGQMDLKRLKDKLMDRFAPLPSGARMGA